MSKSGILKDNNIQYLHRVHFNTVISDSDDGVWSTVNRRKRRSMPRPSGATQSSHHKHQQFNMPDITSPPPGFSHKQPHNRQQQSVTSTFLTHNAQQQQHNRQSINRSHHTNSQHRQTSDPPPRPYIFPRPNHVPHFVTEPNRDQLSVKTNNRFSLLNQHQDNLN